MKKTIYILQEHYINQKIHFKHTRLCLNKSLGKRGMKDETETRGAMLCRTFWTKKHISVFLVTFSPTSRWLA